MSIDYTKGYTASFYATTINPSTWADENRFEIVSGSVNRENSALRNSASMSIIGTFNYIDSWIRIYMDVDQNGGKDRTPIFTGLATSPGSQYKDGVYTSNLDCYSVLKPAEDIILPRGWYVMAGENGIRKIKELLSVIPAPVEYEDGAFADEDAIVQYSIVAEDNETNLSMVEKILNIINWRMQIFGDGTVYLSDWRDASPVTVLSPYTNNVIETEFQINYDLFNCPNVFQAIYGDFMAIAKDESEDSILSTVNRGREIWMVEDAQSLEGTESLASYARRRLKEEQSKARAISYNRRYLPGLYPDDMIHIDYNEFYGDFYIDSQTITLGHAAVTSENITEVV